MLISFLALIASAERNHGLDSQPLAWFPASIERVLGVLFAPIAWLIGVPLPGLRPCGNLLGTRMVMNELVASLTAGRAESGYLIHDRLRLRRFALCGFANFSSIGIQIGGIGALAPNKRGELARLGFRAMLAGTMANLMSASIAGMLL